MSAGDSTTRIPASERAFIFSAAVPFPPEMMAPAWPILRPGGAVWPAEDGCEVEDVVVAGGFEAEEGGRGVFIVLVELFD